jgi:hypothetical protein
VMARTTSNYITQKAENLRVVPLQKIVSLHFLTLKLIWGIRKKRVSGETGVWAFHFKDNPCTHPTNVCVLTMSTVSCRYWEPRGESNAVLWPSEVFLVSPFDSWLYHVNMTPSFVTNSLRIF